MSLSSEVQLETAYERKVLFALELVDAVTLARVSQGVKKVVAQGLKYDRPILGASGYFVWLEQDMTPLTKITLDLGGLPYDPLEIPASAIQIPPPAVGPPLVTFQLHPRLDYPFSAGNTGIRGALIETRVVPPQVPTPVAGAEVALRWLENDNITWRDSPTVSQTNSDGDFVSILRFAPTDAPELDPDRKLTVQLRVRRGPSERRSPDLPLPQGRIADPLTMSELTFAWDELNP